MKPEETTYTSGANQSQAPVPPPNSYLALAIITTILCCMPLGIVSIVHASRVESLYRLGDIAGATYNSQQARKWAFCGIGFSVAFWVLYFIFCVCLGMASAL